MAQPKPNAGDVEFELGGQTVTLKCSLDACLQLTGGDSGIAGISERVRMMDLGTMCRVIRLGMGLGAGAIKDLEKQVYEAGLANTRQPLQAYLANIINGGKPFAPKDDEDQGEGQAAAAAD
jgi:hypothetical protein